MRRYIFIQQLRAGLVVVGRGQIGDYSKKNSEHGDQGKHQDHHAPEYIKLCFFHSENRYPFPHEVNMYFG